MKIMNQIVADRRGTSRRILCKDRRLGGIRATTHVSGAYRGLVTLPEPSSSGPSVVATERADKTVFEKIRSRIAAKLPSESSGLPRAGIKSVAVYSTADAESLVVHEADEAVQIGPPATGRSYLHIPSIIGAALKTGADALHPGYGFLSEDPYFAEICSEHGIVFIGPRPEVMERVGNKAVARDLMQKAGLAVTSRNRKCRHDAGRGSGNLRWHRLPRDYQGGRRGRRPRYDGSLAARGARFAATRRRAPPHRRSSRTVPSTLSATFRRRVTQKSRSCAISTGMGSTWANGIARSNGAIRSSSRKRLRST